MRILWLSWKDINHPEAGGAELVSHNLRKNLVRDGHTVTLLTARYPGSKTAECSDGIDIIRTGGRFSVYLKAAHYYRKNLKNWPDAVVDEMNTIPFFASYYSRQPAVLLTYQLAREVWFYQMMLPFSLIGFLLEPIYLRLLASKYRCILTESESTKADLVRHGFKASNVHTFRVGMEMKPAPTLAFKKNMNSILFLGALRPMKQPIDAIRAFEIARDKNQSLTFTIAGSTSGKHAKKALQYINRSRHREAITVLGRVENQERIRLMREAALILVTSSKEGWGLIVTEANSQGTPAIAYNTDGLRDSIVDGKTGLLVEKQRPDIMGDAICDLLQDPSNYSSMCTKAHAHSKQYSFKNSYEDFIHVIKDFINEKEKN